MQIVGCRFLGHRCNVGGKILHQRSLFQCSGKLLELLKNCAEGIYREPSIHGVLKEVLKFMVQCEQRQKCHSVTTLETLREITR
jgi:hypothetical protein